MSTRRRMKEENAEVQSLGDYDDDGKSFHLQYLSTLQLSLNNLLVLSLTIHPKKIRPSLLMTSI